MSPRTFRRIHHAAGIACVIAWAVVMGTRAKAELTRRQGMPDVSMDQVLQGGESRTYGVYHGDTKVGYSASRRQRGPAGWVFHDQAVWRMVLQGVPQKLVSETSALVGDDFALKSFHARVDAGVAVIEVGGRVEGDVLAIEIESAGRTYTDRITLTTPPMLPALTRASVAARRPKAGESFVIPIFNPLARGIEEMEIVVEARETLDTKMGKVETWRLTEIMRGAIRTQVWIDDHGETIRETSPLGMRIEAEPREIALALDENAPVPDLVKAVSVPVHGNLASQVGDGKVRIRLKGTETREFPLLAGGWQRVEEGNIVVVEKRHLKSKGWFGGYTLPYNGQHGNMDAHLASEPLVQSEDPEIVKTARAIVGEERDVLRASRKIHEWVHENVEKRNSAGVPSAVEVLQTRSGDCNEHTVLFVALARAVKIPSRIAVGMVWATARGAGPGLYYHAWPEVFIGGAPDALGGADYSAGWYPMDPTLGQEPADVGHVRFLVGNLERQIDLLKLIGKLEVEVLPSDEAAPIDVAKTTGTAGP